MPKRAGAVTGVRISGDRAGRLYRLLKILESSPATRAQLLKRLKVGMRTFYRDVDLLRECGVNIETRDSGYELHDAIDVALGRLPYPDPELTFGEVLDLMRGRSASHLKLRKQFANLTR